MWYGSSVSKAIFLALVLLVLITGAFALRVAWDKTPRPKRREAHNHQANHQISHQASHQVSRRVSHRKADNS